MLHGYLAFSKKGYHNQKIRKSAVLFFNITL